MLRKSKPVEPVIDNSAELEELRHQLSEAEAELAAYRSTQDITDFEIKELKRQLAEAGNGPDNQFDWKAEIASRDAEIASLKAQSGLSYDMESLKTRAAQAEYLKAQLDSARATISDLEQQMLRRPAIDQATVDQAFARAEDLETQIAALRGDFANSEQKRRDLESELDHALDRAIAAESAVKQAQEQAVKATSVIQEVENLSAELAGREQTITELRKEVSSLSARVAETQNELVETKRVREMLEIETQKLQDQVANLKFEVTETNALRAKLAATQALAEGAEAFKAEKARLEERIAHLEKELESARSQAEDVPALKHRVQQLEADSADSRELKEDLDYIQALLEQAMSRLNGSSNLNGDLPQFLAPLPKSA